MKHEKLLSSNATLIGLDGLVKGEGLIIARYTDDEGDTYYGVGSTPHWGGDVIEEEDGTLTLLASGAKVIL